MSKKEKLTEQKEEKIVTKYDKKVQKRKEQKEKEQREKRRDTIISVVIVAALVCFVASFPIRSYLAVHETYVTIGGEDVTRVEFEYNYNQVVNSYMTQYGSYLSYFGLDTSSDLSTQMYTDTLTWKDYFEQMTVDNMLQNKALAAQAKAEGYTYDATERYNEFVEELEATAAEQGVTVKEYVKQAYGSLATLSRISEYVKEDIVISAYYDKVSEEKAPSDEEIQAYYENNKADYESVDYRITTVKAELPTEPTELADPVEESTDAATDTADTTDTTEEAYEPSEAEIAKAMEDARKLADEAETKVAAEGELRENIKKSSATSAIREWLFDDSRQSGDTTVIEDTNSNQYYVLAFEKRYLDESPSVDIRAIITEELDGQAILDEWKSGEATEESFGELCDKYTIDTTASDGGLIEGVVATGLSESMAAWLFDEARVAGDTTSILSDDGTYTYVLYYVGQNAPEWKLSVKNTLLSDNMSAYLQEIRTGMEVEDSKGKLNYLKIQAAVDAAAETVEAASTEAVDTTAATEETTASQAE